MFSLSATALPGIDWHRPGPALDAMPPVRSFLALYDGQKP
jgi:hypothetical protein